MGWGRERLWDGAGVDWERLWDGAGVDCGMGQGKTVGWGRPLLPTVTSSVGPWYDNHEDCPRSFSCTQEKAYGNYNYNSRF